MNKAASKRESESGMALLVVALGLSLLAAIVMALSNAARVEVHGTANLAERVHLDLAADAGVALATRALVDPERQGQWVVDGRPVDFNLGGMTVTVRIVDVAGLIDVNTGPAELLGRLMVGAGLEPQLAGAALAAIRDWSDADNLSRLGGDERTDYRRADLPYGPRNSAIESLSELLMIAGFPTAIYPRILPFITVHSGASGIDSGVAPAEVLASVPGIDPNMAANLVRGRRTAGLGASLQGGGPMGVRRDYFAEGQRQVFAIDVAIGAAYVRRTVVSLTGTSTRSWRILAQYDLPRP